MKVKAWIKSPWTISLGTALFSFLLTLLNDKLKNVPIFSTLSSIFQDIWRFILSVLDFNIKVWWLLIGLSAILFIIYFVSGTHQDKPDFFDYTEDRLLMWKWTWRWKLNSYENVWHISDLKAHCPHCDTILLHNDTVFDGEVYYCPRCSFVSKGSECEEKYRIEALIIDNNDRRRKARMIQEKEEQVRKALKDKK